VDREAPREERPAGLEEAARAFEEARGGLRPRIPVSTYRLQFNSGFRFEDARAILSYLDGLGVTDLYASPVFKAQKGSMHGYDVVDLTRLNPELGSDEDFDALCSGRKGLGMGLIMDIVPNHMSVGGSENRWWLDVLENGQSSPYARFFDIDWKPVKEELENKVILPILGEQYGKVLENQELRLIFEAGGFHVAYYGHRLPIDPSTYTQILGHRIEVLEEALGGENPHHQELLSIMTALRHLPPCNETDPEKVTERHREKEVIKRRIQSLYEECPEARRHIEDNVAIFNGTRHVQGSFDLLDALLYSQVYRLAYWRVATEEINYRRFFDINDLAAIRVEDPEVFMKVHELVLGFVRQGKATGLRIDHPDGLYNPTAYFRKLQEECFVQLSGAAAGGGGDGAAGEAVRSLYRRALDGEPGLARPFYIVGEKILIDGEPIPEDWTIFGTTGYGFMNSANGLFVDSASAREMDRAYSRFTRASVSYQRLVYESKKFIMQTSMASELNVLGHRLNRISEKDRHYRDFTLNDLTDAIVEIIAFFPVYRTYIDGSEIRDRDRLYIESAVARARQQSRDLSPSIFDFIREVLLLRCPDKFNEALKAEWLEFTMKFQQLTGPIMAKGLEDTAFYSFNRLASLNEVGGNPSRFGVPVEAFHAQNLDRREHWPHALIATSTHDSKRGEDVRARINVISEFPGEWRECLSRWGKMNRKKKKVVDGRLAPDRNEEYLFYQTLLGAWPAAEPDAQGYADFKRRMAEYMLKAAKEAKVNTNWMNPRVEYEEALAGFVSSVMDHAPFVEDFRAFQRKVAHYGAFNSLSQTLLKITSPGVPDFYQGTETWNLSLVDPDNRRPVDYAALEKTLRELRDKEKEAGAAALARELLRAKEDGRIKMFVTSKALHFRRANREVFLHGDYVPLEAAGRLAGHIVAFARSAGGRTAVTVAPRLLSSVAPHGEPPVAGVWEGTYVLLPSGGAAFRDVFTSGTVEVSDYEGKPALHVADALRDLPVSLLERGGQ